MRLGNGTSWGFACGVFVLTLASVAAGQRPDGPNGQGPQGFGPPPGGPRDFPMMQALDADGDGKISKAELTNAVVALRKLDKDKDGKLSGDELGWPPAFGRGGRGGRGGPGGFGGPGRGGPGGPGGFGGQPARPQRPDPDNPNAGARRPAAPRGPAPRGFFSAKQLQQLDRNKDGVITRDEIPRRMQSVILDRLDKDESGAVEAAELKQLQGQ